MNPLKWRSYICIWFIACAIRDGRIGAPFCCFVQIPHLFVVSFFVHVVHNLQEPELLYLMCLPVV